MSEDEAKSERDRQVGNVIYAHFNEVPTFQEQLLKANLQGDDRNTIITTVLAAKKTGKQPAAYVEGFDGKNLALNLCVDNLHFSFNLRDSIFDNANRYYERGKNEKEKAQGAFFALSDSKRKLAKAERELAQAEQLKSLKPAEIMETYLNAKWNAKTGNGTRNSAGSHPQTASW